MRYNRYLTFAVILFIIYSVYKGHSQEINHTIKSDYHTLTTLKPVTPPEAMPQGTYVQKKLVNVIEILAQTETGKKFLGDAIQKVPDGTSRSLSNNPAKIVAALSKDQPAELQIVDSKLGDGPPAVCGETVTVNDSITLPDGKVIDSTNTFHKPLRFQIGKGSVIQGLELGVRGMKKGAIRTLVIPASLAYDNKRFSTNLVPPQTPVTASVELLDIAPSIDIPPAMPAAVDSIPGRGRVAQCGDNMLIEYIIVSQNGTVLIDSTKAKTPIILNVNDTNIPIGMMEATIGMHLGGTRTINLPGAMMQTIGGKPFRMLPPTIHIRSNDMFQVTIHLIALT